MHSRLSIVQLACMRGEAGDENVHHKTCCCLHVHPFFEKMIAIVTSQPLPGTKANAKSLCNSQTSTVLSVLTYTLLTEAETYHMKHHETTS